MIRHFVKWFYFTCMEAEYVAPEAYIWVDGADGTANGALVFDGQFALGTMREDGLMNAIPVGNDPFTILAWFKTNPKTQGIIRWGTYAFNQCNAVAMYSDDLANITNYWWDNDLKANRGYSVQDDNWHQVAITYTGTARTTYIDGIRAAGDNPPPHNVPSSENFLIGKTWATNPTAEFFVGAIDDIKVYNYALTELEVARSYTDIAL